MKIAPDPNIILKLLKTPFKPISRSKITSYLRVKFKKVSVIIYFISYVVKIPIKLAPFVDKSNKPVFSIFYCF